jgi:alpha-tubulin suppressor-like RCC1 family protein
MSSDAPSSPSARYVAPDFKRRQLLFDSFTKLGAAGGSSQKNISDAAVGHGAGSAGGHGGADGDLGPKGTLLYTWGAGYHGQLGLSTNRKKCRMQPACIDFREPVLVVACGGFHTAVLTDDGRVYSWGDGRFGQLGNLARKHNMHSTPHLVDWLVSFKVAVTALACGQYHTAAISNQGKLFTWGSGKWSVERTRHNGGGAGARAAD